MENANNYLLCANNLTASKINAKNVKIMLFLKMEDVMIEIAKFMAIILNVLHVKKVLHLIDLVSVLNKQEILIAKNFRMDCVKNALNFIILIKTGTV